MKKDDVILLAYVRMAVKKYPKMTVRRAVQLAKQMEPNLNIDGKDVSLKTTKKPLKPRNCKLTPAQRKVLEACIVFADNNQDPYPSLIVGQVDYKMATVANCVIRLEAKGYIETVIIGNKKFIKVLKGSDGEDYIPVSGEKLLYEDENVDVSKEVLNPYLPHRQPSLQSGSCLGDVS